MELQEYASRFLAELQRVLAGGEPLVQGDVRYVEGWLDDEGGIRVVYDRDDGADRRFGRRAMQPDGSVEWQRGDGPESDAFMLAEDIDEPLGRHGDLLVEEDGVWWWGDGYPTLDDHRDHLQLQTFMDQMYLHHTQGAPRPEFPFRDESIPGAEARPQLVVRPDGPPDEHPTLQKPDLS